MLPIKAYSVKVKNISIKILISLFIIFNLFCVILNNTERFWLNSYTQYIANNNNHSSLIYTIDYRIWQLRVYSYVAGLNSRWSMFGKQSRLNWKPHVQAYYKGNQVITLPIPLHSSQRNFFEKYVIDFKQAKFQNSLYGEKYVRKAYANYLCERYPLHDSQHIKSIQYSITWKNIKSLQDAIETKVHYETGIHKDIWETFLCPSS